MADWISGGTGAWSAGANVSLSDDGDVGLMAGIIHETATDDDLLYANIGCTFPLNQ